MRDLLRVANSAVGLLRVAAKLVAKAALLARRRVAEGETATITADDIAHAQALVNGESGFAGGATTRRAAREGVA